ncbi:uncharacterized protein F5Z01DRAFT_301814 [Emericellopsis atlantica]|uniref:Uncharacterized protein n=1 Tax=Emericellopsis atlantica TaxID=2614577 RepID=A0A9P7ZT03_9HYPO|nr:uncharacterized protein F5Z01DRAFT_301814 [Emericellopsis atlantica]KAG9257809.1 hypothetical protein F5Z01DRAFT_301814 [Emericellopsis atlantica]
MDAVWRGGRGGKGEGSQQSEKWRKGRTARDSNNNMYSDGRKINTYLAGSHRLALHREARRAPTLSDTNHCMSAFASIGTTAAFPKYLTHESLLKVRTFAALHRIVTSPCHFRSSHSLTHKLSSSGSIVRRVTILRTGPALFRRRVDFLQLQCIRVCALQVRLETVPPWLCLDKDMWTDMESTDDKVDQLLTYWSFLSPVPRTSNVGVA